MLAGKIGYFRHSFTPRSLSGLVRWHDASDTSTMTLNGSNVSEWRSLVGTGNALTQATAIAQPALLSSYHQGRSALSFDGGDFLFNAASPTPVQPVTVAVACDETSWGQFSGLYSATTSGNDWQQASGFALSLHDVNSRVALQSASGAGSPLVAILDADVGVGLGKSCIVANVAATSSAAAFVRRNGQQGATDADYSGVTGTASTGTLIGGRMVSGSVSNLYRFNGRIMEVCVWDRALTLSEVRQVELYLSAKWGITLAPQVSNADAQSWINRVYANGGTVSTSTATAVNDFCNAIDSAGLRDRFYRLNLFAGTGLASALVPLYRGPSLGGTQFGGATDTNSNFVAGDYSETSGLKGNGSNKHLLTGLLPGDMGGPLHQAFSIQSDATVNDFVMGCDNAFDAGWTSCVTDLPSVAMAAGGAAGLRARGALSSNQGAVGATILTSSSVVRYVATSPRTSGSGLSMYQNGTLSETRSPTYATHPAFQIAVFGGNRKGTVVARSRARLSSYSIGLDITAGQAAAYNAALVDFLAAIGRATA
jgi:hypothetical protein